MGLFDGPPTSLPPQTPRPPGCEDEKKKWWDTPENRLAHLRAVWYRDTLLKYTDPLWGPIVVGTSGFLLSTAFLSHKIALPAITKYGGSRPTSQVLEQFRRMIMPINHTYTLTLFFTGLMGARASSIQRRKDGHQMAWSPMLMFISTGAAIETYRIWYKKQGPLVDNLKVKNMSAEELKKGLEGWKWYNKTRIGTSAFALGLGVIAMSTSNEGWAGEMMKLPFLKKIDPDADYDWEEDEEDHSI